MTVRNDITVDFVSSPRIALVAAPSLTISIQDLWDTLMVFDGRFPQYESTIDVLRSTGKQSLDLAGTRLNPITLALNNTLLKAAPRPGPVTELFTITDGNLVAIDDSSPPVFIVPLSPSAFISYDRQLSQGAALIQSQELLELARLKGLDIANPVTYTPAQIAALGINIAVSGDGVNTTTLTRQP